MLQWFSPPQSHIRHDPSSLIIYSIFSCHAVYISQCLNAFPACRPGYLSPALGGRQMCPGDHPGQHSPAAGSGFGRVAQRVRTANFPLHFIALKHECVFFCFVDMFKPISKPPKRFPTLFLLSPPPGSKATATNNTVRTIASAAAPEIRMCLPAPRTVAFSAGILWRPGAQCGPTRATCERSLASTTTPPKRCWSAPVWMAPSGAGNEGDQEVPTFRGSVFCEFN